MSGRPCAPYFSDAIDGADAVLEQRRRLARTPTAACRPRAGPARAAAPRETARPRRAPTRSPVRATYAATAYGSQSRSSEHRVRVPRPLGGCHQCCTSPSTNCRDAARSRCARHRSGPRVEQRQHVLQLIAETECAARLIRTAARPDAAAERLIEQPAVHDQIERVVRRAGPGSAPSVSSQMRSARASAASTCVDGRRSVSRARARGAVARPGRARTRRCATRPARSRSRSAAPRTDRGRRRRARRALRGTAPPARPACGCGR